MYPMFNHELQAYNIMLSKMEGGLHHPNIVKFYEYGSFLKE